MNTQVSRPGHMVPGWPSGVETWADMEAFTRDQAWADAAAEAKTCQWADRLMSFSFGACVAFFTLWAASLILTM